MINPAAQSAIGRLNMSTVAIAEHYISAIQSDIQSFADADVEQMGESFARMKSELCMAYGFTEADTDKTFAFSDGVAIIPIHGLLLNRFGASWGFVTGYNFIRAQTLAAKNDPDVTSIIYDVNSGGGEVAGCDETAQIIASVRGVKPTLAVVDAHCYSAAYWSASAADKIAITPSGGAGSIGAMCMHFDYSKELENYGIRVTLLHAGEHKVDGNPYEPLSDTTKASMQESLDEARNGFAASVALNRGIKLETVLATEARCYSAKEALELKLVDYIADAQSAATLFLNDASPDDEDDPTYANHQQEPIMAENTQNQPAALTAEDVTRARAEGVAEGVTAERTRIAGIMSAEAATGREALANHFAFNTTMDVESALAALQVSPVAAAAPTKPAEEERTPSNPFANAMNGSDNPGIGAGADTTPAEPEQQSGSQATVDSFFAAHELLTGRKAAK